MCGDGGAGWGDFDEAVRAGGVDEIAGAMPLGNFDEAGLDFDGWAVEGAGGFCVGFTGEAGGAPGEVGRGAGEMAKDGPEEEVHDGEDGDGIAWQCDDEGAIVRTATYEDGLAGLDGDAVDDGLDACFFEGGGEVIVLAGGDAADGDEHVSGGEGAIDGFDGGVGIVGDEFGIAEGGAEGWDGGLEHFAVGVANL